MNHTLHAIQQSQRDHANDSWIDDISTFDGKLELYLTEYLNLKKELALGRAQGAVNASKPYLQM